MGMYECTLLAASTVHYDILPNTHLQNPIHNTQTYKQKNLRKAVDVFKDL